MVYDEGPLYIFSPTEELRKRWIHQLKSGECGGSAAPLGTSTGTAVPVPGPQGSLPGLPGSWLPVPCLRKEE